MAAADGEAHAEPPAVPGFGAEWPDGEPWARRAMCGRCLKPAKVCLCSSLPAEKLSTPHVQVLVLQHPEEAGAAKNTVALLQLCLADCRVVTGRKFRRQDLPADMMRAAEQSDRAHAGIRDASTLCWQRTLLLWPAPDAEDLEHLAPLLAQQSIPGAAGAACGDDGGPETESDCAHVLLVVLDGTWPSCGQMLQKSEVLRGLRTVRISPPGECLYAIRMEPSPAARSTLEAVAHSIAILERGGGQAPSEGGAALRTARASGVGEAVRDALLRVMLRMVELQCAYITNPKHRKVDAKHYRPNRYNVSAVTPLHLRGGVAVGALLPSLAAEGAEGQTKDGEGGEVVAVAPGGGGVARGVEGAEIVSEFMRKCKNKTALLELLVKTAQAIERVWDQEPLARRYDMLAGYRECLLLLGEDDHNDGDVDLVELARLGPKIRSLDFPLSHFLALVLPIERKYSKGLRDHEFLITTDDAGLFFFLRDNVFLFHL
jgi:DTW domain-containing protein